MGLLNRGKSIWGIILLLFLGFGYAGSAHGEETDLIKDPQLEHAIRFELDKLEGDLTASDLEQLKELTGNNMGIKSLEGLEYAKNLTRLSLVRNQISDLSPIRNLSSLTSLNMEANPISDISPVSNLTRLIMISFMATPVSDLVPLSQLNHLEFVNFSITRIKDLSPLSNLTSLKTLELMQNGFSDLSPLSNLVTLERLTIGSNKQISDLTPLKGLSNLKILWITEDKIKDISSLSRLVNLEELHAYSNEIADISPLQGLQNLETVNLENNKIQDPTPLLKLKKLKHVYLRKNPVSEEKLNEVTMYASSNLSAEKDLEPAAPVTPSKPAASAAPAPMSPTFPGQTDRKMEFADVKPGDWYYDNIRWAVGIGMVNGYDDGTFVPDAKVTEAEFLKMFISLYTGELATLQDEIWYDAYYKFAEARKWDVPGLFDARSPDQTNSKYFIPNKPIIRLEAAMFLLNAIGKEADAPDELIWEMYNNGFSNGKTSKTVYGFHIDDLLTRAEAVSFLRNFKESNLNKELLAVTQVVESNRILSLTKVASVINQSASDKGCQVQQPGLSRRVREEGNINQLLRVSCESNPNLRVDFEVYVSRNQITVININLNETEEARAFTKEILIKLFKGQAYNQTILDAFDMMPNATPGTMDVTIPYNQSSVKFSTTSFNIRLDESDKAPFGSE